MKLNVYGVLDRRRWWVAILRYAFENRQHGDIRFTLQYARVVMSKVVSVKSHVLTLLSWHVAHTAPVGAQTNMFSFVPYAIGYTIDWTRFKVSYAYDTGEKFNTNVNNFAIPYDEHLLTLKAPRQRGSIDSMRTRFSPTRIGACFVTGMVISS